MRSSWMPKRAMSPSIVVVSMSWFDASAYGPSERAKGMRLPPRTTADLVSGMARESTAAEQAFSNLRRPLEVTDG